MHAILLRVGVRSCMVLMSTSHKAENTLLASYFWILKHGPNSQSWSTSCSRLTVACRQLQMQGELTKLELAFLLAIHLQLPVEKTHAATRSCSSARATLLAVVNRLRQQPQRMK